ncbi:Alpha/Beta hydrolase protein, partial [Schizophyllum commune]
MPVSTLSSAVYITPTVIKTFAQHSKRKARKFKDGDTEEDAKDDIFFDEAFHIVKAFIEMGTKNTVESLQAFTNTHVPSPYWAAVAAIQIPFHTCNQAADALIEWFGPEDLKRVVGGERWWQVRGLDGIDAEWITQKDYLGDGDELRHGGKDLSTAEETIQRMEHLDRVMLYVHGGGYFWGSVNTHRYQIIRYARKFKGRAFAVNYRKAPQYPWPCPVHDVLAAYLYLITPPPGAPHKPVNPSKIVFAGDSAGGGLSLTVMTVLRDLGLPLPAGGVLISPWVDLTHSFPSVMSNTPTPANGDNPANGEKGDNPGENGGWAAANRGNLVETQEKMLDSAASSKTNATVPSRRDSKTNEIEAKADFEDAFWEPKPPKVLMRDPKSVPLELHSQIQQYGTNEQLSHPLVSPVLQGSLGNLPPLYILAGDGEVLRDEIMYIAHKAAHPEKYPARAGVLREGWRQKENAEKFKTPTKVHLQVFDGMCHVLTVFSFTNSAKYAYRSIAQFVKHVTDNDADHLDTNPFPELHRPSGEVSSSSSSGQDSIPPLRMKPPFVPDKKAKVDNTSTVLYEANEAEIARDIAGRVEGNAPSQDGDNVSRIESVTEDVTSALMIRERVDVKGFTRPMEPEAEIPALQLKPHEIGLIREEPAIRWHEGQKKWDKRYRKRAHKVVQKRKRMEARAAELIERAKAQGLEFQVNDRPSHVRQDSGASRASVRTTDGVIQEDRRWGPLDLDEENPPPSAIAGRRDTHESLALLRKTIYHTAPQTHTTIPRMKTMQVIRAAFDPHDDPLQPPKQSVSEQQTKTHIIPMHGLRIWDTLLSYFMRKSQKKALDGGRSASAAFSSAKNKLNGSTDSPLPTPPKLGQGEEAKKSEV